MSHTDHSPLVKYADRTAVMAPCLCGSTLYYAALSAYGKVAVDWDMAYDKRMKSTHRFDICDTHGPISITVPVSRPDSHEGRLLWSDIQVSAHGSWWNTARVTLESAYGRTPFFEYYRDRLLPLLDENTVGKPLHRVAMRLHGEICSILGITSVNIDDFHTENREDCTDMRKSFPHTPGIMEYWQVRSDRFGFIPALSILDLIFNMGPEAPLVLRSMSEHI